MGGSGSGIAEPCVLFQALLFLANAAAPSFLERRSLVAGADEPPGIRMLLWDTHFRDAVQRHAEFGLNSPTITHAAVRKL